MPEFSPLTPSKKRSFFSSRHRPLRRLFAPEQLEERSLLNASNVLSDGGLVAAQQHSLPIDRVFAPGTPAEIVAQYENLDVENKVGIAAFTFNDSDRWSSTTTSGSGLTQGAATTITWSVVPDGTPVSGFNGEPASPSNLRSF